MKDGDPIRGYAVIGKNEIGAQTDNPEFAYDDLVRHEIMEQKIGHGEIDADTVLDEAAKYVDKTKIDLVVTEVYLKSLGGDSLTGTAREKAILQARNELVCDGADHINQLRYDVENGDLSDTYVELADLIDEVIGGINRAANELTDGAFELDGDAAAVQRGSKTDNGNGAVRFSIKYDLNNTPYVVVENDVLAGIPKTEWVKVVKDNLRRKFPDGVTVGKNAIAINQSSRREMTFSNYMRRLFKTEPQMYADKLRATDNADEILQAARNWVNEALLHPRADAIIDFARGEVQLRIGSNDYKAQVIVGNRGKSGLVLYDIINLAPASIQERTKKAGADSFITKAQNKPGDSQSAPATNSITDAPEKSNSKFSAADTDSEGASLMNPTKDKDTRFGRKVDLGDLREENRELRDKLIALYGAIPEGERPFRDVQVPRKTEKDKKVSQTVRTILEAKATPDEAVPTIEKMVEDGVFSYEVYSDKKAMSDAETDIRKHGWAKSLHDWLDSNGRNDWEYWTTFIQDKNNTIWEATLNIANTANGEKILYDIVPITEKSGAVRTLDTSPLDNSILQNTDFVNAPSIIGVFVSQ